MYNIYCDNINTLGYERKQNAYIVLLLKVSPLKSICLKTKENKEKRQRQFGNTIVEYYQCLSKGQCIWMDIDIRVLFFVCVCIYVCFVMLTRSPAPQSCQKM